MIDGVHIWRAALDEAGWPGPGELPAAERERAGQFLREEASRRWVASRWALRGVLGSYLETPPVEVELEVGERGKPRLRSEHALQFNLSHSQGLALVAVAARPVGVDIEAIRPRRDLAALAERALPAPAIAALQAAPAAERVSIFHRAWARHEAGRKCLGAGLGAPPAAAPITVREVAVAPGFAAAVAVAGTALEPPLCRSFFAG